MYKFDVLEMHVLHSLFAKRPLTGLPDTSYSSSPAERSNF